MPAMHGTIISLPTAADIKWELGRSSTNGFSKHRPGRAANEKRCRTFPRGHVLRITAQAKAMVNEGRHPPMIRNATSQAVAANGISVQNVPRWPRSSCTTAQANAVAYGETYFHESSIDTLARTLLPTGEGYRTFPGGHDLRAPRRRQRRWRTEKTYFHGRVSKH